MLTIGINYNSKEPMYEQIYTYIREEIKKGNLTVNTKLPSSRGLALNLAVSRNTVDMAYAQLQSEGYIKSLPKKGYYVCQLEHMHVISKIDEASIEKEVEKENYIVDFSSSGVDMTYFPYNKWRKIMKDCVIDDNSELFQSGHHQGDIIFRDIIRTYIHQSRGVNCDVNQIVISAGSDYSLLLLSKILGDSKKVAMENPTYLQAYKIFKNSGYEVYGIGMDKDGMIIDKLRESGASIAYIAPSHQFPLGTVMPINRRMSILAWAAEEENRYIIEDDYDSEFRYFGKPIPALQGNDINEKVIYTGTFSKAIAPAIRISYMVLPKSLLKNYHEKASFYFSTVSRIDQAIVGEFISQGHFERHLNKMRGIYKSKHDLILKMLKKIDIDFNISGESAGLHLLLEFSEEYSEEGLVKAAAKKGVKVYPLSDYYIDNGIHRPTIILGYARLSEKDIEKGIFLLENAWKEKGIYLQ